MKLTLEFFNLLLLILPGLVASQIFYVTAGIEDKKLQNRIIDSLIFSFIIYLLVGLFAMWEPLIQAQSIDNCMKFILTKNRQLIILQLFLMVIVPLLLSAFHHNDIFMKLLRKFKITSKSSRPNTWADVFISQDRYVVAYLKDGRRIRGYPTKFSTDHEEGYVYLFNPAWINDSRENTDDPYYFETGAHGFLINRSEVDFFEFTLNNGEQLDKKKERKNNGR